MPSHFPEQSTSNFMPPPAGVHRATCFRLIDLGTQQSEYQGKTLRRRQVILDWELADELMEDQRPFTIAKFYTWSMSEKANLRKDLEAWRGVTFQDKDLGESGSFKPVNLLGAPCLLNVIHEPKANSTDIRAKIASISRLPKNTEKPTLRNPKVFFDLDNFDGVIFEGLREGIRDIIGRSPEYQAIKNGGGRASASKHDVVLDDDIPF